MFRLGSLLLAGLLVLSLVPVHAAPPVAGKRYAVLVGVKEYDHSKLKPLDYPENDVDELAAILRPAGYEVTLLTLAAGKADPKRLPSRANIEARLAEVLEKCKRDDTVLVALAGHGLQFEKQKPTDPDDAYFCPTDARPLADRRETLLSLKGLYQRLDDSGAGVKLMLVDACRDDPTPGRGRGVDGGASLRPPAGVAALFSCSAGERAFESDKLKHGVFFHYVLEGLKGKAAQDGEVSWDDLQSYVRKRVSNDVSQVMNAPVRQTPALNAGELRGASPVLVSISVPATKVTPSARPAYVRGKQLFEEHEYEKAIDELTKAVREQPDEANGWLFRAWALSRRRRVGEALSDANKAVELAPRVSLAYAVRSLVRADDDDTKGAIADADKAIELDGRNAVAHWARGYARPWESERERAISDFSEAIRLDPRDAMAWALRGSASLDKQDYNQAIADCSEAIRLDAKLTVGRRKRGLAYSALNESARAGVDFSEAVRLDPKDSRNYTIRAKWYTNEKSFDKALDDYTKAAALDPGNQMTFWGKALNDLNTAAKLTKVPSVEFYQARGVVLTKLGRIKEAEADFSKTTQGDFATSGAEGGGDRTLEGR